MRRHRLLSPSIDPPASGQSVPSAQRAGRPSALDGEALARLVELDPSGQHRLVERVFTAYRNSVARLMPQLQEGRRSGNLRTVADVAHTFKSSSASIGGIKLSAQCAEIETMIRTQQTEGLDARLDAMCAELAIVLQAVSDQLNGQP